MAENEIIIPFSFPLDPNAAQLAEILRNLINETTELNKRMHDMPIEELTKKNMDYANSIGKIAIETMKLNPAQEQERNILFQMKDAAESLMQQIDKTITIKKIFNEEARNSARTLNELKTATVQATNDMFKYQEQIYQLNKKLQEGEKLTKAEEDRIISLTQKVKDCGVAIQNNTEIMEEYNIRSKENIKQMDTSISYIDKLRKELTTLKDKRDELTQADIKAGKAIGENATRIQKLNAEINTYERQISGVLDFEYELQKVREKNIIIENRMIASLAINTDVMAENAVQQKAVAREIANKISLLETGMSLEQRENTLLFEQYEKQKALEDKKLKEEQERSIKKQEQRQKEYEQMWLNAEKAYEKEQELNRKKEIADQNLTYKQERDGEVRAAALDKEINSEVMSINKMKAKISELEAQWAMMGLAARNADTTVRPALISMRNELERAEQQSRKTNFQMTVLGQMLHSLKTFAIMSPGFFVFGAVYAGFQKLIELFTLGTQKLQDLRKELEDYTQKLRDIGNAANAGAEKEIATMNLSFAKARDTNLLYDERIEAVKELRKLYEEQLRAYTDEELMLNTNLELQKKITQQIILQASVKANIDKIGLAATRAAEAQQKKDDAKGEIEFQEKLTKLTEQRYKLRYPNRDIPSQRDVLDQMNVSGDVLNYREIQDKAREDILQGDKSPENMLRKQRLEKRSMWDKLFDDGTVNVKEQKDIVKEMDEIIKQSQNEMDVYQKRALNFMSELDKMKGKDGKVSLKTLEAKLQAEIDKLNSFDLSKEGITDQMTGEEIHKKRLENDKEWAKISNRIQQLKSEIAALKGDKIPENGGKQGKNIFLEKLRILREQYETEVKLAKETYDKNNPNNTYEDDIALQNKNIELAKSFYDKKIKLITEYHATKYLDQNQEIEETEDAENKRVDIENKSNETINKIQEDRRKRYEQAIRDIELYNDRIRKLQEEIERLYEKANALRLKNESQMRKTKHVNPLGAMFGMEDEGFNFEEDQKILQNQINAKQNYLSTLQKDYEKIQRQYSDLTIESDILGIGIKGNSTEEKLSNDKKGTYTLKVKEAQKFGEEMERLEAKMAEENISLSEITAKKEIDIEERKAAMKKDIWQKSFEFGEQLLNNAFDAQKGRIQFAMQMLQKSSDYEMQIAGNNENAKLRIAARTNREMLNLKRKEAQVEKDQAVFTAMINTLAAATASLMKYPLPGGAPFLALNLATGFAQMAAIASKPLPAYKGGRKRGKKELARINEEGFELVEGKKGLRIFGGGMDTIAQLEEGDTVHTHAESKRMIDDDKFLKDLLKGTGVVMNNERNERKQIGRMVVENMISKKDLEDAMYKAVSKIQPPVINIPSQHVTDKHSRQLQRNNANEW